MTAKVAEHESTGDQDMRCVRRHESPDRGSRRPPRASEPVVAHRHEGRQNHQWRQLDCDRSAEQDSRDPARRRPAESRRHDHHSTQQEGCNQHVDVCAVARLKDDHRSSPMGHLA